MNTHKRKKRLRANRHKKKARQINEMILIKAVYNICSTSNFLKRYLISLNNDLLKISKNF